MIRNAAQLTTVIESGRTVARLTELGGGTHFHWVTADTIEPVHGSALKALERKGVIRALAFDLCGDPMQWGAAND